MNEHLCSPENIEKDGYSSGRNHYTPWISITLAWICSLFCAAVFGSHAFQTEMLFGKEIQTLASKKRTCFTQRAQRELSPLLVEMKLFILDRIIWLGRKLIIF